MCHVKIHTNRGETASDLILLELEIYYFERETQNSISCVCRRRDILGQTGTLRWFSLSGTARSRDSPPQGEPHVGTRTHAPRKTRRGNRHIHSIYFQVHYLNTFFST